MRKKIFLLYIPVFLLSNRSSLAQAGMWTWMKGADDAYSFGNYGTQGVAAISNNPPYAYGPCKWQDHSGNFWIFGSPNWADLWKFDPATNMWTWMKGPGTTPYGGSYGTMGISSPDNAPPTLAYGAATWVDLNGDLWMYGGRGTDPTWLIVTFPIMWRYSISTNEWTWVKGNLDDTIVRGSLQVPDIANTPGRRYECTANWMNDSGNFWFYGGFVAEGQKLFSDMWRYNPSTNEWTWMSGSSSADVIPEYGVQGTFDVNNTPGARANYAGWVDDAGKFWLFGGLNGFQTQEDTSFSDLWEYDPIINEWAWISGSNVGNNLGNAGVSCDTSKLTYPKARFENRATWKDSCGNFYMYGGSYRGSSLPNMLGDLWMYQPLTKLWSRIEAGTTLPVWGTFGVAAPANSPGERIGAVSFIDEENNLWLFGGFGDGEYNDLFKYVPDPLCPGFISCSQSLTSFYTSQAEICEKFCIDFYDQSANNPTSWLWQFPGGEPSSSTVQNPNDICYDLPGIYDVTLITTNYYESDTLTLSNYITVYATPPFPTITQNGYTLASSPAVSYQWQLNAVDIPGATNQSYAVLQTGFYTVIITDENGCVNSSTIYVQIVGIDEVGDANISVYPNPSNGNFVVELSQDENVNDVSIDIVNALGQRVFSSQEKISSSNRKKEIELNQPAGIYFLRISSNEFFIVKKITISK